MFSRGGARAVISKKTNDCPHSRSDRTHPDHTGLLKVGYTERNAPDE